METLTRVQKERQKKEKEICQMYIESMAIEGAMAMAVYEKIIKKYPLNLGTVRNILRRNGVLQKKSHKATV